MGDGFENPSSTESAYESFSSSVSADTSSGNESDDPLMEPDPPVQTFTHIDMLQISRRRPDFGVVEGHGLPPDQPPRPLQGRYRDVVCVQSLWREHAASAASMFPKNMWRMLRAVQTESRVTQTNVLKASACFLNGRERKQWPLSRQRVDDTLSK